MAVIHIDSENFNKEVKNSKSPIIVDFWAPWCGPCQMMGPVFESLSNKYDKKLKFLKLNTDEHPDLANQFEVQGIPTLIVLNGSKEVEWIVGYFPEGALKQKIDNALKKI